MRTLLGLLSLPALALGAVGCSTSGSEASSSGSAEASSPTGSSREATSDPVTFFSKGSACASIPGDYVMWDAIEVQRPLTVTRVELSDDHGVRLRDQMISTQPEGAVPSSGIVRPPMPAWERPRVAWDERQPALGATLRPGETYYLFLDLHLPDGGSYAGIDIGWDDGETSGTSRWQDELEVRKDCT